MGCKGTLAIWNEDSQSAKHIASLHPIQHWSGMKIY